MCPTLHKRASLGDLHIRNLKSAAYSRRALTLASRALLLTTLVLALWLCATPLALAESGRPIRIVTTTGIIGDTTRAIAGDLAVVESLMGPGVDPHLFKASPRDVRLLAHADLVIHNGLHLEGKLSYVLDKLSQRKPVTALSTALSPAQLIESGQGTFDPHIWFDVKLWSIAASTIEQALIKLDPAHSSSYAERYAQLKAQLVELDGWCREQLATIPPERRALVTAHDAFSYLGRAYQLEVIGVQGINTESEASLRSINGLISLLVDRHLPAVFIESSVSPKTVQALINGANARGHPIKLGGELYSDALGEPDSGAHTYQAMIKHNITTITQALAGASKHD